MIMYAIKTNSPEESEVIVTTLLNKGIKNPKQLKGECKIGYYTVSLFNELGVTFIIPNDIPVKTLENII